MSSSCELEGMATGASSATTCSVCTVRRHSGLRKMEKDVAKLAAKYLAVVASSNSSNTSNPKMYGKPVRRSSKDTTPDRNRRSFGSVKIGTLERSRHNLYGSRETTLQVQQMPHHHKEITPGPKPAGASLVVEVNRRSRASNSDEQNRHKADSGCIAGHAQLQPPNRTGKDTPSELRRRRDSRNPRQFSPGLCKQMQVGPSAQEKTVQSLMKNGFLSHLPTAWKHRCGTNMLNLSSISTDDIADDLSHVSALFSSQVSEDLSILGVYRVENAGLKVVYSAVRATMGANANERILWHGTSTDCVCNIALNGFNRAYCGRHGMKFGHGTYFSTSAVYSTRFCDRRRPERLMFLASVLVGRSAKGSPELIEPPHRDEEGIVRYDSTVDDINNPSIFCVFRDYQAMPLYLIHFSSTDHSSAAAC